MTQFWYKWRTCKCCLLRFYFSITKINIYIYLHYHVTTLTSSCIYSTEENATLQWMYNQCYNQFFSTGHVFWSFVLQRANISGKFTSTFFLNIGSKDRHFNKFRKFVRSACLHVHFYSLSQTFHRTDIQLSKSQLQMCNKCLKGLLSSFDFACLQYTLRLFLMHWQVGVWKGWGRILRDDIPGGRIC